MMELAFRDLTIELDESGRRMSVWLAGRALAEDSPLVELWVEGTGALTVDDMAARASAMPDLLTAELAGGPLRLRVDLMRAAEGIRLSVHCAADWPEGAPLPTTMRLPWLAALKLDGAQYRYPGNPAPKRAGGRVLQGHDAYPTPYALFDDAGLGLSVSFDLPAARLGWDQLRNQELCAIGTREAMEAHALKLRVHAAPALVAEALLSPLTDGWREAFSLCRARVRARMDFGEYDRPDLAWIRDAALYHFTYAYGREFFNYETGRPDIDRLLDEGERFGGYDVLLIWHQYPRLGLDERGQWDFFDDYPGGLEELKRNVAAAHARGARVMMPFKPWDRAEGDDDRATVRKLCRVIAETDLDGIFFDTMSTVPLSFRKAVDAVKPGVVFVTEGEPADARSFERITCSWDQYWSAAPMPEVNLSRYLFPEHIRHGISRWNLGSRRDMDIERAVFNGTGLVVWQDVFGAWLPYTQRQKEAVARAKALYRRFLGQFRSKDAIPLLPTPRAGLLCNLFPGEDSTIVTFYNDSALPIEGRLLGIAGDRAVELWQGADVRIEDGALYGRIGPGATWVVEITQERGARRV
ncbi:MAG: hypothetical protein GX558_08815 [Clostridiales bacterium]|nr:hypothetical protein [Clostridiales bacterium]